MMICYYPQVGFSSENEYQFNATYAMTSPRTHVPAKESCKMFWFLCRSFPIKVVYIIQNKFPKNYYFIRPWQVVLRRVCNLVCPCRGWGGCKLANGSLFLSETFKKRTGTLENFGPIFDSRLKMYKTGKKVNKKTAFSFYFTY